MSFILDALKKSEAERQRRAGPALLEMRAARPRHRIPVWVWIAVGVLVALNLSALVWWLSGAGNTATLTSQPPATTAPAAAATVLVPAAPVAGAVQSVQGADSQFVVAGDVAPASTTAAGGAESDAAASPMLRYEDMPAEMPKLRLDMHVYSPVANERYAYINMRKVREGDTTADGMRVLSITSEGVELRYRNSSFFLGREP